ncbi:hypothetical protein SAMN02745716_1215 [Thermoleophilum album]|uniref:Uncharacterized protein n=1 Tax=Thermoleophilum album TaxID=29539 RepID=A0A1H6FSI1_THEAL|nr:hypothetical protein SAMN02745716_1215 [Thermoleophilum album]
MRAFHYLGQRILHLRLGPNERPRDLRQHLVYSVIAGLITLPLILAPVLLLGHHRITRLLLYDFTAALVGSLVAVLMWRRLRSSDLLRHLLKR